MKSNRLFTFILSGAMVLPLAALAQTSNPGTTADTGTATAATAPKAERGSRFAQKLNLTADQKADFKSIRENAKQQAESIKNDSTLNAAQKKAKLKELHKSAREQMMSKLTPDQQKTFKQMRKEHRHERAERRKAGATQKQG
ncbi:MAG TPA: hypothetical protein VFQ00_08580 [Terriglobales bacterium]|nr:hypothetical protein [Terriglobales bacterium]